MSISVMPTQLANLVAAGEVVERPASVVKELLENAVDAGATQIFLEIKRGGIAFIRCTDNGAGMSAADARLCFLPHATSKLKSADELFAIGTMGFRGEALASIGAVSRIELLTRQKGEEFGTSIVFEGGELLGESEVGCPEGTTFVVRELFYNTPARYKFLKKDTTEVAWVTETVQKAALGNPHIAFRLIKDGTNILNTPGDGHLGNTIRALFGKELTRDLLPLTYDANGVTLRGFAGTPASARTGRAGQHVFLLGRPVRNKIFYAALDEAYRNACPPKKNPLCFLWLTLPPHQFDINIHPAKSEVKFQDERAVFSAIFHALEGARAESLPTPVVPTSPLSFRPHHVATNHEQLAMSVPDNAASGAPMPDVRAFLQTITPRLPDEVLHFASPLAMDNQDECGRIASRDGCGRQDAAPTTFPVAEPPRTSTACVGAGIARPHDDTQPHFIPTGEASLAPKGDGGRAPTMDSTPVLTVASGAAARAHEPYRLIDTVLGGYLLLETADALLLLDKHAAHERILYNNLRNGAEHAGASQMLLQSLPVTVSPREGDILCENMDFLTAAGFELEPLAPGQFLLRAAPYDVAVEDATDLLCHIASALGQSKRPDIRDRTLYTIACKAAVKLTTHQSRADMEHLAHEVMTRDDVQHCPHGRPVLLRLERKELEAKFLR